MPSRTARLAAGPGKPVGPPLAHYGIGGDEDDPLWTRASKGARLTALAVTVATALCLNEGTASAQAGVNSVARAPGSVEVGLVERRRGIAGEDGPGTRQPIRDSLRIDYGPLTRQAATGTSVQAAVPAPKRSVAKRILGGAVGATGGFFAGFYLGAAIEGDRCECDDPGFLGALIGAPVGAVTRGILGSMFLF